MVLVMTTTRGVNMISTLTIITSKHILKISNDILSNMNISIHFEHNAIPANRSI